MPWNLELAAVPESKDKPAHDHANMKEEMAYAGSHDALSIDDIILKAEMMGFTGYKLFLPRSETGVYTVAANSMGGDIATQDKIAPATLTNIPVACWWM